VGVDDLRFLSFENGWFGLNGLRDGKTAKISSPLILQEGKTAKISGLLIIDDGKSAKNSDPLIIKVGKTAKVLVR
jgi:hypothetical protein